jgi:hypothetical protein
MSFLVFPRATPVSVLVSAQRERGRASARRLAMRLFPALTGIVQTRLDLRRQVLVGLAQGLHHQHAF